MLHVYTGLFSQFVVSGIKSHPMARNPSAKQCVCFESPFAKRRCSWLNYDVDGGERQLEPDFILVVGNFSREKKKSNITCSSSLSLGMAYVLQVKQCETCLKCL